LEVPEGTTVRGLLEMVGAPPKTTDQIFVNSEQGLLDQAINEGDVVAVFPPVAGG
jgi:molybdopterin converting factor small subunit